MTPDMMHDAGPDVSRFGNKGFHPAPIAGRKARSGNIIVRRTSKIGRHYKGQNENSKSVEIGEAVKMQ